MSCDQSKDVPITTAVIYLNISCLFLSYYLHCQTLSCSAYVRNAALHLSYICYTITAACGYSISERHLVDLQHPIVTCKVTHHTFSVKLTRIVIFCGFLKSQIRKALSGKAAAFLHPHPASADVLGFQNE